MTEDRPGVIPVGPMSEKSKQLEGGALLTDGTRSSAGLPFPQSYPLWEYKLKRKAPDPTPPGVGAFASGEP